MDEMEKTILFFRANEPLSGSEVYASNGESMGVTCQHTWPVYARWIRTYEAQAHRALTVQVRIPCRPTRGTHARFRTSVRIPERCKRVRTCDRPRGGFRLIVRPILHPLVLIHRIVKWRWPNLLLYRIMVILCGELWNGGRDTSRCIFDYILLLLSIFLLRKFYILF